MYRKLRKLSFIAFILLLFLSACSPEKEQNHILITHSENSEPLQYPADVQYHYVIEDGYQLPKDNMLVTFKWKSNGQYNSKFWMYEVKKSDNGYSVQDSEYEGFFVDDVTELGLGFSPVSELSGSKGIFTVRVANETQYRKVIGEHPNKRGTHNFEEILINKQPTTPQSN